MLQMIRSECGAVRQPNRQIRKHGKIPIDLGTFKGKVVTYFVDCEEEVLVGGCADDVCAREKGGGKDGEVAKQDG